MKDFNAPTTVFWQANAADPWGNVIDETLGNGVHTVRGFDLAIGVLDYIQSGLGGGTGLQDLGFTWDAVGNLTQRQNGGLSLTEGFGYDNLHRLTSTTGTDPRTMTYDALGNITSKTGVGTYTYHATKKHQVTATTGGALQAMQTYSYDDNGNMNSRNGLSTTWYSYNLPNTINGPSSNSSQFFYSPDRSRWKQVASYAGTSEQTIYVGGLLEKVTLGGATHWKHYIAGGTGVVAEYIRHSTGTNETVYLLKDHLGSTEMITNSAGAQMSRLSYDAWGRRRNGDTWNGNPAGSAWTTITNTTRHGFTSHEMLDNLNLVHMNGRVYDPIIGRFMSADPIVQAPGFTQSFNRYSYTFNNPLSYTDPSGFEIPRPHVKCNNDICNTPHLGMSIRTFWSEPTPRGPIPVPNPADVTTRPVQPDGTQQRPGSTVSTNGGMSSAAVGTLALPRLAGGSFRLIGFGSATFSAILSAPLLLLLPDSNPGGKSSQLYDSPPIPGAAPVNPMWAENSKSGTPPVTGPLDVSGATTPGDPNQFDPNKRSPNVQFGGNSNQIYHAFRHVDQLGLDRAAVQSAIRQDLLGRSLTIGELYSGSVEVGGIRLQYNAYRLTEEIINVGRITGQ